MLNFYFCICKCSFLVVLMPFFSLGTPIRKLRFFSGWRRGQNGKKLLLISPKEFRLLKKIPTFYIYDPQRVTYFRYKYGKHTCRICHTFCFIKSKTILCMQFFIHYCHYQKMYRVVFYSFYHANNQ